MSLITPSKYHVWAQALNCCAPTTPYFSVPIRMPGIKITVDDSQTKIMLEGLSKKLKNLGPITRRAVLYQERQTKLNFAKESDPDGTPWAALKPSTLARKKTRAKLREESILINSVSSSSSGGSGRIFATDQKGIYHMTGTRYMPARPFLGFSARNVKEILELYKKGLL